MDNRNELYIGQQVKLTRKKTWSMPLLVDVRPRGYHQPRQLLKHDNTKLNIKSNCQLGLDLNFDSRNNTLNYRFYTFEAFLFWVKND